LFLDHLTPLSEMLCDSIVFIQPGRLSFWRTAYSETGGPNAQLNANDEGKVVGIDG
jgi:hypothetical protein